jgi:hypothetical protein
MAKTIYFKKENNGNVTIRKIGTESIIYALQPTQNLTQDIANPNCIIIKSAISSFDDRGIVINCNDIDSWACHPVIYPFWEIGEGENWNPTPNDCLTALLRDFFFCGCHKNQFAIVSEPISVGD